MADPTAVNDQITDVVTKPNGKTGRTPKSSKVKAKKKTTKTGKKK